MSLIKAQQAEFFSFDETLKFSEQVNVLSVFDSLNDEIRAKVTLNFVMILCLITSLQD